MKSIHFRMGNDISSTATVSAKVMRRCSRCSSHRLFPNSGQSMQVVGMAFSEPFGGHRIEAVVDRRADDARVRHGRLVEHRREVLATLEVPQHGQHLLEHRGVVRVGSQEAQDLVQLEDTPGSVDEILPLELAQQCESAPRNAAAELGTDPSQLT